MPRPGLASQAKQIAGIMAQFVRVKTFLPTSLPGDLSQFKEEFVDPQLQCCPGNAIAYTVFYRLGLVLSGAGKPLTMSEIAEGLTVPLSTATRLVDGMVRSGYVHRLSDSQDRRVVRIALTGTGEILYQGLCDFVTQRIVQVLKHLNAEERRNLVKLLGKVVMAMEKVGPVTGP